MFDLCSRHDYLALKVLEVVFKRSKYTNFQYLLERSFEKKKEKITTNMQNSQKPSYAQNIYFNKPSTEVTSTIAPSAVQTKTVQSGLGITLQII